MPAEPEVVEKNELGPIDASTPEDRDRELPNSMSVMDQLTQKLGMIEEPKESEKVEIPSDRSVGSDRSLSDDQSDRTDQTDDLLKDQDDDNSSIRNLRAHARDLEKQLKELRAAKAVESATPTTETAVADDFDFSLEKQSAQATATTTDPSAIARSATADPALKVVPVDSLAEAYSRALNGQEVNGIPPDQTKRILKDYIAEGNITHEELERGIDLAKRGGYGENSEEIENTFRSLKFDNLRSIRNSENQKRLELASQKRLTDAYAKVNKIPELKDKNTDEFKGMVQSFEKMSKTLPGFNDVNLPERVLLAYEDFQRSSSTDRVAKLEAENKKLMEKLDKITKPTSGTMAEREEVSTSSAGGTKGRDRNAERRQIEEQFRELREISSFVQ